MIPMQLKEIATAIGGELLGSNLTVDHIFTDSRIDKKLLQTTRSVFIALKGPYFDAHQFLEKTVEMGAVAAIVESKQSLAIPQIIVKNSRLALADLGRFNRQKSNAKYVAITGSSGKTTVKEMIASILSLSGKTFATLGNFNNDIGVPLTLLAIDESIEYGVVEIGANRIGEIAFTAGLVKPDVAVVNNVAAAHLQGFGDLNGVAKAKAEVYDSLNDKGIAVINADDKFGQFFSKKIQNKIIQFSMDSLDDRNEHKEETKNNKMMGRLFASKIHMRQDHSIEFELSLTKENTKLQSTQVTLPLVGMHNISNALAAASCCLALDIPLQQIAQGLSLTPVIAGRLVVHRLSNNWRVIDDSYNANLASMLAAIDLLRQYPEPRILVIGEMGELGKSGREIHEQIGRYAQESKISKLFSSGALTQFAHRAFSKYANRDTDKPDHQEKNSLRQRSFHYNHQSELIDALKKEASTAVTILVKGSRSAKMEKVVDTLLKFDKECSESFMSKQKPTNVLQNIEKNKVYVEEEDH